MNCALHTEAIVDGLSKNYANLQAVVKFCQLFVSELSTVIDSTNQILIPGADIMEWQHQWNVYRLPRVPLASLTESRSSVANFFFFFRPRWEPVRRLVLGTRNNDLW